MGFDTEYLSQFVSDMLGWRVDVVLGDYRNMQDGYLGLANSEMICLRSSLVRNMDPILPRVFFHELGHIVLHKRENVDDMTQEAKEKEAELFANEMLLRYGDNFVWDGLKGDLSYDLQRRAKTEIMTFADSKIFKRNRIVKPYQSSSQSDVEVTYKGQRRTTAQPQRMTASALEAQGQQELRLAAKVTNPTVAAMIRKSAQGKLEVAKGNGRQGVGRNAVDAPMQYATPYRR